MQASSMLPSSGPVVHRHEYKPSIIYVFNLLFLRSVTTLNINADRPLVRA